MYLARLLLNPRSQVVQRDLADCYRLHRRILSVFPDLGFGSAARRELGVLYRPDGYVLLIQSRLPAEWQRLPREYLLDTGGDPPNPAVKDVAAAYDSIVEDRELRFKLRANPTRKIDSWRDRPGFRPNGRRVDLRREEDQIAWLVRKGQQHGFRLLSVRVRPESVSVQSEPLQADVRPAGKVIGWRVTGETKHPLTFAAVVFEGVLRVEDRSRFRQALENGIGSGKAFGFGLLSIAPIRG
ncbi:MAG: type I-E CRISPR-associated protein Cas6/Cse3/CasE [Thermomicrobium sp.]|nr:type I-E CRISPR-associated protein Cas6/Cse3/CasE [Thermomicrobium sp.]MCX7622362.1 type I-E CRISPR-associated protein Cas6/Cse3/CasE [Thermomicrobium sp.]MDW8006243.1 type I-E CRISPR-associated protein Cas6/Cse3/CasE [Thermomicrobium sp.]